MADDNLLLTDHLPTRSDAVKNRALLLETARRLFAEQGVENVPMSAVAETAGVGKGTLYRHFENKSALCHALLDHANRDLQVRTLERLRTICDAPGNLRWLLAEFTRFVTNNEDLLSIGDASGYSSLLHPAHWWVRQTIHGLLKQIHPPGDLDYLADLLYIMVDAHTIRYLRHARSYDMQRMVDGMNAALDCLLVR